MKKQSKTPTKKSKLVLPTKATQARQQLELHALAERGADTYVPEIDERLGRIHTRLVLISAAMAADELDLTPLDDRDVMGAALSAAREAIEEVHWLRELPAKVLALPAPDCDQRVDSNAASALGEAIARQFVEK